MLGSNLSQLILASVPGTHIRAYGKLSSIILMPVPLCLCLRNEQLCQLSRRAYNRSFLGRLPSVFYH